MEKNSKILEAGDYLLREGEESSEMYYVVSGTLSVLKAKGGVEQQIGNIYSGEVVGELSFIDQRPRSASVKALSDCELVVIPQKTLEDVNRRQPLWYQALTRTLSDRLRKANTRIRI